DDLLAKVRPKASLFDLANHGRLGLRRIPCKGHVVGDGEEKTVQGFVLVLARYPLEGDHTSLLVLDDFEGHLAVAAAKPGETDEAFLGEIHLFTDGVRG